MSKTNRYKTCPTCKGLGFVVVNDETDEEGECPDCEGAGKLDEQGFSPSYSHEIS